MSGWLPTNVWRRLRWCGFSTQPRELILGLLLVLSASFVLWSLVLSEDGAIGDEKLELGQTGPHFARTTTPRARLSINNRESMEIFINTPREPEITAKFRTRTHKELELPSDGSGVISEGLHQVRKHPVTASSQQPAEFTFTCPVIQEAKPDFDSVDIYPTLDFTHTHIWDAENEQQYLAHLAQNASQADNRNHPLRIIVVPHSHNDPGWGWTLDQYYSIYTVNILNLAVEKLTQYPEMRFIWSEVAFLDLWWRTATTKQKNQFKELVHEGRLELTTGGWVMTDEAVVHLPSMILQLIEGQEWLQRNVGANLPETAWSVDPFGFGPVMPYLLKSSGIDSMIIMRIHHAWKRWFVRQRKADFRWGQRWSPLGDTDPILCHQSPFTLYSMAASLGPDSEQSYKFNFIAADVEQVTWSNVREKATGFLEQASRHAYASSSPESGGHNTIMVILGDDFRFRNASEWDNGYTSFNRLFTEINSNPERYGGARAEFGSPRTFFKAVRERQAESTFPLFHGDFFVYSDAMTDENGRGAYWSGFYASRPFWKQLYRDAEAALRSAEILYAFVKMKGSSKAMEDANYAKCFTTAVALRLFKRLQIARRHVALFAHHDAVPGVSDVFVMRDYGHRLNEALIHATNIQTVVVTCLILGGGRGGGSSAASANSVGQTGKPQVVSALTFPDFKRIRRPVPLDFPATADHDPKDSRDVDVEKHVLVFNSLTWAKLELVRLIVTSTRVQVFGPDGTLIPSQLNPVLAQASKKAKKTPNLIPLISDRFFELVFFYQLEAVSVTKFKIVSRGNGGRRDQEYGFAVSAKVRYRNMGPERNSNSSAMQQPFEMQEMDENEELTISNQIYKLKFNSSNGLLRSVVLLKGDIESDGTAEREVQLGLKFGAYVPMEQHDGPYLFMPKSEMGDESTANAFHTLPEERSILVVDGPLETRVQLITPALQQTVKLLKHTSSSSSRQELAGSIFITNGVHVGARDGEYFMRLDTDIDNAYGRVAGQGETPTPVMFTDQSGFTFEKRTTIPSIQLEGNSYPITTLAYIQEKQPSVKGQKKIRLSLLVGRAHAVSSFVPGRLELLIERRTPYDDGRGIEQGIQDNRPTVSNYVLRLEVNAESGNQYQATLPTLETQHISQRLNFPVQTFYYDNYAVDNGAAMDSFGQVAFFKEAIPADTHLLALRTQASQDKLRAPSDNVLMILQKIGYSCGRMHGGEEEMNLVTVSTNPDGFFYNYSTTGADGSGGTNWNAAWYLNTRADVKVTATDLTGLRRTRSKFADYASISAQPFQISSFLLHL